MQTKHFIASTTLLLIFATAAAAQNAEPTGEWRILNVPELGMSLKVPAGFGFELNTYESDPRSDQKKSQGEFQSNDERFFIFVDSDDRNEQFNAVTKFIIKNIDEDNKKTFLENKTGRVEFTDKDGYYHRVRFFKTGSKMITLQTVSTDKESTVAERFLNSISFSKDGPEQVAEKEPSSEIIGSGWSTGDLGGRRANSDPDKKKDAATSPKSANAPLRLISKPRAQYTDFARFYNIQGTVRVRVAFGDDSKIGAVTVLDKLPFGLVDEAVKAAKGIKFKPQEREGEAITTIRVVEYKFTIY